MVGLFAGGSLGILIAGLFLLFFSFHCPGSDTILIEDIALRAQYACTREEQERGLSYLSESEWDGRADAMVFLFKNYEVRHFWMYEMRFPLDVLWVKDGVIVKMESNLPIPTNSTEEPARMDSIPYEVDAVIELRAGSIVERGIHEGMYIRGF